ncbi:MAG: hypothetical protein OXP69_02585 [Spirochaetaceae bacterium]|nr:hypothetical protein [Spirochaetaceae bacterium]
MNTSHRGTINDLAYDAPRRMLFSAGEDGTVRVWSHDRRAIVRHLRLGAVRVMRIALHPDRPLLAAVARSTAGHDLLEVWDWRSERRLYRHRLHEAPLHLGFTSLGSSLVYSRAQFDSVVFLEPTTGRRQDRLSAAFGIVSYVAMSTNERTIMTYQPTGEVRYWDAATSALKAAVPTLAGLESIALSADKNLLVARSGEDLVAIDVVTGAVRSRLRIPRQAQVVVADQFAQVSVLQPDDREDGVFVLQQRALDRALTAQLERRLPLGAAPTAAAYAHRTLFFAEGGTIREVLPADVVPFARDELVVAEALAADGATLLVATRRRIAVARLQRSEATPVPHSAPLSVGALPRLATTDVLRNPFGTAVGLTVVPAAASSAPLPASTHSPGTGQRHRESGAILVWNREGESGRLGTLDPRTGRYRMRISGLPAPLSQVSLADERLVLLDSRGNIAMYQVADVLNATVRTAPKPEREFWAPGTGTVLSIGDHLIAGRTRAHATTTPLLKIDATHAETLLIPDDALLIFDLAQHAGGQLLTLGVEPPRDGVDSARTRTVLRMRDGSDLARQRLVYGFSGEDLSATLAEAPDRQRIYFTLGADAVRVWDGTRLREMERTDRQPRQLVMVGGLLVARNADATFTVWNRYTRRVLFHLYLFHDFNWIVARPNGDYVHSPGAERYLADSSRR